MGYMISRAVNDAGDLMGLGFIKEIHEEDLFFSIRLPHVQTLLIIRYICLCIRVPKDRLNSTAYMFLVLRCEGMTEFELLWKFLLEKLFFWSMSQSIRMNAMVYEE